MRGALIHGILLAVMLVYGYRTWTRDKTVQPNVGSVVLWNKAESDIATIEYRGPKKLVKLERKPEGYWWGTDTTVEVKVKPKTPDANAAGSGSAGSGSAGSGAGSGSAAKEPEVVTVESEETNRKTREFPLGDNGDKLVKSFAAARALRDLGKPTDAAKKDYKLGTKPTEAVTLKDGTVVSTSQIIVTFKDGTKRTFTIGGSVYGGSDKYAVDDATGKAYVLSKELLSGLEVGQSTLQLTDPRGFDAATIGSVVIEANGKSKVVSRIKTAGGADGAQQVKTWGDAATGKADQTAANFVDNANNLKPTDYPAGVKVADLQPVLKLSYREEKGAPLGTLSLFKREKTGELPPGAELDPANPPKSETEYFIVTERTRVPALVRKDAAQRMEQDIETVFSGKQPEPKSVDPKGNPFGNAPMPPIAPGAGSAAGAANNPHGMQPTAPAGMAPTGAPAGTNPTTPGPSAPPTGSTGTAPSSTNPSATPSGSTAAKPATPTPTTKAPAPATGSAATKAPPPPPAPPAPVPAPAP